ncbi:hypothetical protein GNT65_09050 [Shewanella sp. JBTF-M18]|uniref:Uncharacterized protein n=1 Tax=Shewanella insulae TaxID=2681496 RepID=A0A6L7HWW7_9GAMM|nr:hypothetical protein [Shewanella insulae]MXR68812.1 hypothetical protein [Shewanella insulae]
MSDEKDKMLSDPELKALYQAEAKEQPSSELDARILAMARQHLDEQSGELGTTANVVSVSFWRRYRWPLSSAASVLLLSSLLLLNLQGPAPIDEQLQPMLLDEPRASKMAAPSEQQGPNAQADAIEATQPVQSTSPQGVMPQSVKVQPRQADVSDPQVQTETAVKAKTQAKAMISDIQAVNHLQQLVDGELWTDADTLYQRMLKERPRLEDKTHPQHAQWQDLVSKIKAQLSKQ